MGFAARLILSQTHVTSALVAVHVIGNGELGLRAGLQVGTVEHSLPANDHEYETS